MTPIRRTRSGSTSTRRRWIVERTLAWTTAKRRCTRDYERNPFHHEAMVTWAMILTMTRHLDKPQPTPPWTTPTS
jgi:transposase